MATFDFTTPYTVQATGQTFDFTVGYDVTTPTATADFTVPYVVVAAGSQVFDFTVGYSVTAAPEAVRVYRVRPARGQVPVRLGVVTASGLQWLSAAI